MGPRGLKAEVRKLPENKRAPEEIRERLNKVCNQGYVYHGEKYYKGRGTGTPDCRLCDFPGCEI